MHTYPSPSPDEVLALRKDVDNLTYEEVQALACMIGWFHCRDAVSDPDGSHGSVQITQMKLQGLLMWASKNGAQVLEQARKNEAESPAAYCEPCNRAGMSHCSEFDVCGQPRCIKCKQFLDKKPINIPSFDPFWKARGGGQPSSDVMTGWNLALQAVQEMNR